MVQVLINSKCKVEKNIKIKESIKMADSVGELSVNSPVAAAPNASTNVSSGVGAVEKKVSKKVVSAKPKVKKSSSAIGGKNVSGAAHPPTQQMVDASIRDLKERNGSSLPAIKKYISSNYKVDAQKIAPFIRKYLKSAVVSGKLVQTKGKGASGSFKLSVAAKNESAALEKKKNKDKKKTLKASSGGAAIKVKKTTIAKAKKLNVSGSSKKTSTKGKKSTVGGSGANKVKKVAGKLSEKKANEKLKVKSIKKSGVVKAKTVKSKSASGAVKPKPPKAKSAVKSKKPAVGASTKKSVGTNKKAAGAQK